MTTPFKQITSGLRFPEGPVAMPDGSVILVEIERETLSRVTPDGKLHVDRQAGRRPERRGDGTRRQDLRHQQRRLQLDRAARRPPVPRHPAGLLHGRHDPGGRPGDRQVRDALRPLRRPQLRGPNDLVFDDAGGFWFTDLGKTRERDNDRGAVYYAKADGSKIEQTVFPLERPNGIGLSPDGKTLYVVETPTARLWAFELSAPGPIESANGPYRGEKGRVIAGLGGYQMFDSLAVDSARATSASPR